MPEEEKHIKLNKLFFGSLLAAALLPACVVVPDRQYDYVMAPALPMRVELDLVPYFYGGFYYLYYPHDNHWIYSRSRTGPWNVLPRDRYPSEIRYKDHDRHDDRDRDRDRR
jgi:hypothetical protein